MRIEHSVIVQAPADRIFALYVDVPNWSRWDPDTRASHIDGPFQVGTKGRLTPTKGNAVPMELTEVTPNRSFTAESRIPWFRMVFDHELHADGPARTRVVHRVTFSGPLTFLLGRMLGPRVDAGLPVTLARLKALVEAGPPAA